jgi:uncharacterized membrane protein
MKRTVVILVGLVIIAFAAYILLKPRLAQNSYNEGL